MKKHLILLSFLGSFYTMAQEKNQTKEPKEKNIEGVTLTKVKKAVEQKADRTIFDFSEQPQLNSGTALDGIKKLPGMVASDVAGMLYQGKMLDVFMDGRPLNISSNELNAFLEGMPANAIERIEIITQPGAEFPATSGGAILNIITSKTAKNYLTATYSGNYSFTDEEKVRSRTNNSLLLNAKNKWFGWQLNVGQNYRESTQRGNSDGITSMYNDRLGRGAFMKAALTFDIGQDRLILNYDLNHNNNDARINSNGLYQSARYERFDETSSLGSRQDFIATYQKKFDDKNKKLDFRFSYNKNDNRFLQDNQQFNGVPLNKRTLDNFSDARTAAFKVDYSQPINLLDEGKVSFGGLYEKLNFETQTFGLTNLEYQRQTAASYIELQAKSGKFDFVAGTRAEDYDISGESFNNNTLSYAPLETFKQFRFFPNASVQYNFGQQVYFALNYNKKITLPSISALNPNNNMLANGNTWSTGNPNLQPTIFDNFEAKLSAFDYAFIGYNVSLAKNQILQKVSRRDDVIINYQDNLSDFRIHNFNVGIPLPFMVFTKPFKEVMKMNFNPDKINFMYLYAGYQKHEIPDMKTKGFWIINLMSQFILPKAIKMVANFGYLTPNGNYFYFVTEKPFMNNLDITLSKKFMNDRLNISVFANDILNGQRMQIRSIAQTPNVMLYNKWDSRSFGISVNYKIPTKNRLAKETPNLLNKDKKEETGLIQGL
ncbi:TonB-dependent receptor domain-containing protein [Bergeyella sp. RCAD1439]|uniref:TonB-dependent receptor domain-containing protein n=1 Tax=Bergeyella anatis TaxID=3113737 RepID=UPI002E18FD37|nr:TonB-dependent receptor [Bergeyella sp. RCAD1439]